MRRLLAFSVLVTCAAVLSCAQPDPFWNAGDRYDLSLVATSPRVLLPELESRLAPVSDSAALVLKVDSVKGNRAFGTVEGNAPHFWVMFRAVGGDTFIATPDRDSVLIIINPFVNHAGFELRGLRSGRAVSGTWIARSSNPASGRFALARAT